MLEVPQDLLHQIKEYEDVFTVNTDTLKKVVDHFVKELEKGELRFIFFLYPHIPLINATKTLYANVYAIQVSVSKVVTS